MKRRFSITIFVLCMIVCLCGCEYTDGVSLNENSLVVNNVSAEEIKQEDKIIPVDTVIPIDNLMIKNEIVELSEEKAVTNFEDLRVLLEKLMEVELSVEDYCTDFYDEFLDEHYDECGVIVYKEKDFYPFYAFVSFSDMKLKSIQITYNVKDSDIFDKESLKEIVRQLDIQNNLSEEESNSFINSLLDFEAYVDNVYYNPEISVYSRNLYGLGVVFEDGKDFVFDGKTYYFCLFSGVDNGV